MRSIKEYLEVKKGIINNDNPLKSYYEKVTEQALRHTTRSQMDDLYSIARPNEEKIFEQYRKANKKHITADFINQFQRMIKRVLSQTLSIETDFKRLEKTIWDKVIPLSLIDPNCILVEIPFIEGSELYPSSPTFEQNTELSTRTDFILSTSIVYRDENIFIYDSGLQKEVSKQKRTVYIGIDKQSYWVLNPYLDEKHVLKYTAELYYFHDFGFIPVSELPGIKIYDKKGTNFVSYKESICWPAYEWFDEAIVRFSSEQVVSIKHANPKLVTVGQIECPTCSGDKFTGRDENNKPLVCKTCKGSGRLTDISDFSTIHLKGASSFPGDSNKNDLYYLNPPTGIKELQDSFMTFIEQGKKALCNDPLELTGSESGIAKELRLEPKQDLMSEYGKFFCYMFEDLINHRLLLRGGKTKDLIKINPPLYYQTRSPEMLKLHVTESMPGDRFLNYMEWVRNKYRSDEVNINRHKLAVLYAPLLLYKAEELDTVFAQGVYDEKDVIRRDYAFYAIDSVLLLNPNIKTVKEIKESCDKLLTEEGLLIEKAPTTIDGLV